MQSLDTDELIQLANLTGIAITQCLNPDERELLGNVLLLVGNTLTMSGDHKTDEELKKKKEKYLEIFNRLQDFLKKEPGQG